MKIYDIRNEFVRRVPAKLEEGVLYICLDCDVVVHKCACGCGEKVVLPLSGEPHTAIILLIGSTSRCFEVIILNI